MPRAQNTGSSSPLSAAGGPGPEAQGQTGTFYNQRDDKYRVLGLKRAKEAYEVAKKEFDRQNELFTRGLIAQSELDRARGNFAERRFVVRVEKEPRRTAFLEEGGTAANTIPDRATARFST